ncbi:DNA glycosylase AlkZ-like family protein [Streptomyces lasalocidi]
MAVADAKTSPARHYLKAFGPVTVDDARWWTGWRPTDTRTALAATGAQAAELDEGAGNLLLPPARRPRHDPGRPGRARAVGCAAARSRSRRHRPAAPRLVPRPRPHRDSVRPQRRHRAHHLL